MKKNSWFYRFRDRVLVPWWSRYALVPALTGGPGIFVAYWFGSGKTNLHGFSEPVVVLIVGIWAIVMTQVKSAFNDLAKYSMRELLKSRDALVHIVAHVRAIVFTKSSRFHEPFGESTSIDPGEAFLKITQPELQIKEIVRRVQMFFADALKDEDVRVLLMRWNPKMRHMVFVEHFPLETPPLAPEAAFYDTTTAAGLAKEGGTMVIVEDIATDQRFKQIGIGRTKKGSMVAYPVLDDLRHEMVLVINVVSNEPHSFKEADRESLDLWLQVFSDRLLLENRLVELKARVRRA